MITEVQWEQLEPDDRRALADAVRLLEQSSFATRVADMALEPVAKVLNKLPGATSRQLRDVVTAALLQALNAAIRTMEGKPPAPPSPWLPKIWAGIAGGLSGFFGFGALALELPVTTTVMLRTIAEIASSEGENVRSARTKLACLEVFALGSRGVDANLDAGYYATRAALAQAVSEAASFLVERQVAQEGAPAVARLIAEIASRFGLVISEKFAAAAVPVIGALGGATINVAFMDHYQNVARGHFIVRRLERKYGADSVRRSYLALAASPGSGTVTTSRPQLGA
jgi:hypothetical protein